MRSLTCVVFYLLIIVCGPRAYAGPVTISLDDFKEEFRSSSNISAVEIVGAAFHESTDTLDFKRIHFKVDESITGPLTVTIQTIDGAYFASGTVPNSKLSVGWYVLNYNTSKVKNLKLNSIDKVAVLVKANETIIPIRWGSDSVTDDWALQVNSQHDRAFVLEKGESGVSKVDCSDVTDLSPIKFNKVCKMNRQRVYREDGSVKITLQNGSGYGRNPIKAKIAD